MWENFQRIIEHFTQIIVKALQNMVLGSGIRETEQTHSGSRIQGSKRHRIPGRVGAQVLYEISLYGITAMMA